MRSVVMTQAGVLELNYLWLPTWIGMNATLKAALEKELSDKIVGMAADEEGLERIDGMVIDYLVEKAPHVSGLRDYLEGLKFVSFDGEPNAANKG